MTTCDGDFGCDFCRGLCEQRPEELSGHCLIATHFKPVGGYANAAIHRLEEIGTKVEALDGKLDQMVDLLQQLVDAQT